MSRKSSTSAPDGKATGEAVYSLDAILAVGYRVRSTRDPQFRRWATTVLREYLVKGFAMDDARLKQAEQWDYFDELARSHPGDPRSEKRFYQKVRDLYNRASTTTRAPSRRSLLQEGAEQDALGGHGHEAAD